MTKPQDPIEPLTARYPAQTPARGSVCHNCQTMLQGGYCHVCGQHAHNPLRSFRHAVEDVFESFWHVDGRIFRTVRDLLVPGKISREYLDGHRVRYIPPLRLYVILSLITFFVAHFLTANMQGGFDVTTEDNGFAAQTTVEAVVRERDRTLAELDKSLEEVGAQPNGIATAAITTSRELVTQQAQQRIDQLSGKKPASTSSDSPIFTIDAEPSSDTSDGAGPKKNQSELGRRAEENARLFAKDKRALVERILTHTPTILLILVPLFALILRFVYLMRPMGYLEHLVVALYSHAFLLLVALAWIALLLLGRAMGSTLPSAVALAVFPIVIPVYLLFSQKRIYGEGWLKTAVRYCVTAMLYSILATFAVAAVFAMALLLKG